MKINYKERRFLSEGENPQELSFVLEDAALQLQSDILATRKSLKEAEYQLEEAKTEYPLDSNKLVECYSRVESLRKGLDILNSLKKELNLNLKSD